MGVQWKQSLADVIQSRYQVCNFIKKRLQQRCFLIKFTKFLRTPFFYRTPLPWWLLLAVNCVNQWKGNWMFILRRKKCYTWTVLLRLVFPDKQYSSEVFQTLLAVLHLSEVAVAEVFCKKDVLENFANHRCFPVNFAKFSRTIFFIEHLWWLLLKR